MARAPRRKNNMEYVNVPEAQTPQPISNNDKTLRWVLLSFGLLCMIQATLNVTLRIFVHNTKTSELNSLCKNDTDQKQNNLDEYFRDGWVYFDTSLYYIETEQRSWQDSRSFCLQRGADLVVINSLEEQEFLRKFHRYMWIGLRQARGNRWIWVDKTPLTTSYWATGEPSMGDKEYCVELRIFEITNSWNDLNCENKNYWICEKEKVFC